MSAGAGARQRRAAGGESPRVRGRLWDGGRPPLSAGVRNRPEQLRPGPARPSCLSGCRRVAEVRVGSETRPAGGASALEAVRPVPFGGRPCSGSREFPL